MVAEAVICSFGTFRSTLSERERGPKAHRNGEDAMRQEDRCTLMFRGRSLPEDRDGEPKAAAP